MTLTDPSPGNESLPEFTPDFAEQDFPEDIDDAVPTRGYHMTPMVGLGGSAGSIAALQAFFAAMPSNSGLIFVVVLHLAPELESNLADLLDRSTPMPVRQAVDGEKVQPNHVYVIPPGKFLLTVKGRLRLRPLEQERGKRVAVDLFFRSLADTHGPHAAAVVFSGLDGDGAIGIKRIKERGGLTIAQDPAEAEYPDMPSSAVATGMVDWILKAAEMPGQLITYYAHASKLTLPSEEESASPAEEETRLQEVLGFLRAKTGRNFAPYKRATVLRRLSRRMQVNLVHTLEDYFAFLRTHAGETGALLQDLLISVTNFFRDRDSFRALEEKIPSLFEGKTHKDSVRVWVAACATGEEAYSLAMLLAEHAATLESPPSIQIFATDLDETAIQIARLGLYPLAITADVSEDRLGRFFNRETRGWRMRREIRELVLFATHDLLQDAPFSRMDLISCRNLLIYLGADAQERALGIFEFSLRAGGLLFLGSSESVDEAHRAFRVLDKKHRIFRQQGPGLKLPATGLGEVRPLQLLETVQSTVHGWKVAPQEEARLSLPLPAGNRSPAGLHFMLWERAGFPSMVLNSDYEILHLSGGAGRFLQPLSGEPSTALLDLVFPALRVRLRAALIEAAQNKGPSTVTGLKLDMGGPTPEILDIRVCPGPGEASGFWLVIFVPRPAFPEDDSSPLLPALAAPDPAIAHLEGELDRLRAHMRDTVEQYEGAMEEFKASNEELHAMNEELRAATEELETSREELQSVNEELSTVNLEMKSKVEEIDQANSDLHNLMAATAIPTLFLDNALRIMRYTPPAVELFNLIPGDVGRSIEHLRHRLDYSQLAADARKVLAEMAPFEREVPTGHGRWFLARILPYRTRRDSVAGVVFTFVDITARKEAQDALATSQEHLRLIHENARDYAIISMDLGRRVISWNTGAEKIVGFAEPEIVGQSADVIFTPEDRAAGVPDQEYATALRETRATDERWHMRRDGSRFWGSGFLMAMHNAQGDVVGLVKIFRDHTEARAAKEALATAAREAQLAARAKDDFLAALSHELRTPLNPALMTAASLETDLSIPEEARTRLTAVRRNIELEARLIDDLLDVTRITNGKLILRPAPCDVHQLLQDATEIVLSDMKGRNVTLETVCDATEHWVEGEAARIQQILWNLLKNAFKFTEPGGGIEVRTSNPSPGRLMVTVTDTGMGIPGENLERIFEPFDQGKLDGRHHFGGLGLGLAISRSLAELHGGSLKALSPGMGLGSTFVFEMATTAPPESPESEPSPAPAAHPLRLLVVEDHEATLTALVFLLKRDGHTVHAASSAAEALAIADREVCDVIISDIGLPDASGLHLMREVRRLHGWPGIALSGYGMSADIEESRRAGFDLHIIKPVKIAVLRQALLELDPPRYVSRGKRSPEESTNGETPKL